MTHQDADLSELLGSRICHDLISPLGAISNGIELLTLSGAAIGPEIALISESITHANARVRFFRIAFGAAADDLRVDPAEIRSVLNDFTSGGRLQISWEATGITARYNVKAAFLAIQCLETALSYGGRISVNTDGSLWTLRAQAGKLRTDAGLWCRLSAAGNGRDLCAAHVQFALLPIELARQGRSASVAFSETEITLTY